MKINTLCNLKALMTLAMAMELFHISYCLSGMIMLRAVAVMKY